MMTRKDYVAVAEILSDFREGIQHPILFDELVNEFADMFAEDNPNFKLDKFVEACNEQNLNNSSAIISCRWCYRLRWHDVARYKTRYKRNQKRFAKVSRNDPEQDLKLLNFWAGAPVRIITLSDL